jgi:hypothetical protein
MLGRGNAVVFPTVDNFKRGKDGLAPFRKSGIAGRGAAAAPTDESAVAAPTGGIQ